MCNRDHEAMKKTAEWATLEWVGIQLVEATEDEPAAEIEMRNCTCGNTLAIWRDK